MEILLDGRQYLLRIDRFYQVIGNVASHSLIHYVLFLILRDHDHRYMRGGKLYAMKCLQTCEPRHILVKYDEVERLFVDKRESVGSAATGDDIITFCFKKHYVRLEEIYLIVSPKYLTHLLRVLWMLLLLRLSIVRFHI